MTEVPISEKTRPKYTVQLKFVKLESSRPKMRRVEGSKR